MMSAAGGSGPPSVTDMNVSPPQRVFISYTGADLRAHADVVADVVRKIQWIAVDHEDWPSSGEPSVSECMEHVESCSILVVLIAHRYGWVPPVEEGGDGERSITWLEVAHARDKGIPVLPFLVSDTAPWPPEQMEALGDPTTHARLTRFKAEMKKSIAGFFEGPDSLDGPVTRALLFRAKKLAAQQAPPRGADEPQAPQNVAERIHQLTEEAQERVRRIREREEAKAAAATTEATEQTPRAEKADPEEVIIPWNPDPSNPPSLVERLSLNLPKRILSIDGRGVHSASAFGFLEKIERTLQARYGAADFRLSDYFDLIGGAGVSSLIAACLACGMDVATTRHLFRDVMLHAFNKNNLIFRFRNLYKSDEITRRLQTAFGDLTLGGDGLKTGLCVVASRLDRNVPYPFLNHPLAQNFGETGGLLLSDVILAGMSLPIYYAPVVMDLGAGGKAVMASGDMSIGSDPALYLFLIATAAAFPFRWRIGKRRLLLLSVGAGAREYMEPAEQVSNMNSLANLSRLPTLMLSGAQYQSTMLLQTMGADPTPSGGAKTSELSEIEPILTYRRYEAGLDAASVTSYGFPEEAGRVTTALVDDLSALDTFFNLGSKAAGPLVRPEHFGRSFDVRAPLTPEAPPEARQASDEAPQSAAT
jgi:hypothetical protein